jgi:aspartate aminotransferase
MTTPTIANHIQLLGLEGAFDVLQRAQALEAQGRNIIHLEIGQPDFETPPNVIAAGKRAIDDGYTHYGPPLGLPQLREAVAEYVSTTRAVPVSPDRAVITPGAKPIMFFAMLALLEPGDEVIYANPGFPIYESLIRFCRAVPVPIPLIEHRGFSFDLDIFAAKLSPRTRLVILNSPHNPTGGLIPAEDIRAIADLTRGRNLTILSDEIYSRIYYGEPPLSIASLPGMLDQTIILDGFSKTYSMTGWRLGYGIVPEPLVPAMNKLMVNSNSCTAGFTQIAGVEALRGPQDQVDRMVAEFRRRRDLFVAGLNRIPGFRCPMPEGAFYAFPNIQGTGRTAKQLADHLLNEAGVACLAGTAFGEYGEHYLRFSIASSLENLEEALARIAKACE